jgi:hypothetical protein
MLVGSPVLLRLADQYILAAVATDRGGDVLDVKALIWQPPSQEIDVLDVINVPRGTGVMQWSEPAWLLPPADVLPAQ